MSFPPDRGNHLTVIGDGYCLYGRSLGAACLAGDIPQIRRSPISGCAWFRIRRAGSFSYPSFAMRAERKTALEVVRILCPSFPAWKTDAGQRYAAAWEDQVRQVTKHAARQKADKQAAWLPVGNMFPGSGVSRHSPDVFWQRQAEHNENRRCGPHKEDAGRNGGLLGGSGKCCAGEQRTWQRMASEAPFVPPV